MEKLSFEKAKEWVKENYSDIRIAELFDEEVFSGNWIDINQFEEEGYENEYDYYLDYGRGEAEHAVIVDIFNNLKSLYELDFNEYEDKTNLYRFMCDEYNTLISG